MKSLISLIILVMAAAIVTVTCQNPKDTQMSDSGEQSKPLKSSEEAVQKGKSDLVEILRQRDDLQMGVTASEIENATAGREVKHMLIDFDKLMQADTTTSLDQLVREEVNTITPLMNGNKVLQVIATKKENDGWRVAGLGHSDIASELDIVTKAAGNAELTLYEIPNINAHVYQSGTGGNAMFYTDFDGRSLRQGASLQQIIPALQQAAVEFERKMGDKVKNEKLVR